MTDTLESTRQAMEDRNREILWPFLACLERGEDEIVAYLEHCGITAEDIDRYDSVELAILAHYRRQGDDHASRPECVVNDFARWPCPSLKALILESLHEDGLADNPELET